jgi:hypothetical protein
MTRGTGPWDRVLCPPVNRTLVPLAEVSTEGQIHELPATAYLPFKNKQSTKAVFQLWKKGLAATALGM